MPSRTDLSAMKSYLESAWDERGALTPDNAPASLRACIEDCLDLLEQGVLRVAEPARAGSSEWVVNAWLKKAILLYFRISQNAVMNGGFAHFYDKIAVRWGGDSGSNIAQSGARIVPPATVRRGACIGPDAVLMPSYVNIGAYVGAGTMVDTWATVGSCAQIGSHVHLSGGVGIGGVLEPLQSSPTIIEDGCFIGARSEIVEGVVIERGSVISMGVFIGQSTKIYDRATGEIHRGRVPAGSVVVPGSLPAADGSHSLYCAVIVKKVDESTRARTSVNEILRNAQ
jgi:2,3,4,5-tetrahydropyridine-2,6-dicarboxylate N-succinyltransferase